MGLRWFEQADFTGEMKGLPKIRICTKQSRQEEGEKGQKKRPPVRLFSQDRNRLILKQTWCISFLLLLKNTTNLVVRKASWRMLATRDVRESKLGSLG